MCYLLFASMSFAATITPTPTERIKLPIDQQINDLKSRIASRVAELKLVERRGIIGTVTEVSDTQLTLNDSQNNTRFVDVDELTKFSSPSAKGNFGISDITKGSKIGVLGLYNKQSRRLLARFADIVSYPTTISGTVYGIDAQDFSFKVAMENSKSVTVDIESITKTSSYMKDGGITKAGFTKLKEGQRVLVTTTSKDPNRFIASRVLIFPDLLANPKISIPAIAPKPTTILETPPTSTGSGKKLTPIVR